MQIQELPDFPAIQQIRDALWQRGEVCGAAVMVGAGFSRLANLGDMSSALPPLWNDFSNRIKNQLYPSKCAPYDPLRLAQEYKAELGEPALEGLIRSLVQDKKWEPGCLHETLLSLPWSDVLTTNWDTLLERTLPRLLETERTYDIVLTVDDIARTRAPRIVKLHGSLPANKPFIITEEDYRTYPKKFAPFVNLAQQVLLENELCLIGFSGDDPNFMQWAGWVRDNLGSASRPIRLIGVLDLTRSRREMLRQNNVTPVDLAPLVDKVPGDAKHSQANSMFLKWLIDSKPHELHDWKWPSEDILKESKPANNTETSINEISSAWRQDRLNYPGWLLAPAHTQWEFRNATNIHYPSLGQLSKLTNEHDKMRLLFELARRHEIAFWPLDKCYVKKIRKTFVSGGKGTLLLSEKIQLCAFLFSETRRQRDWENFEFWADQLREINDSRALAELFYGRALRAKQELDYSSLEEIVPKISGHDPVWKMRQGMLYAFLYDYVKAAKCFQTALETIRTLRAKDKQSIWLLSREAWADWVCTATRIGLPKSVNKQNKHFGDWPSRYRKGRCDPWDYISYIDREVSQEIQKNLDKKIAMTSSFGLEHRQNELYHIRFNTHTEVSVFELLTRLQEVVGIPDSVGHVALLSDRFERIYETKTCYADDDFFAAASFISDTAKGLIASAFNRIEVAKIPQERVLELAAGLRTATDFLLTRVSDVNRGNCVDRIRRNIELISRLCERMPPEEACYYYRWALALCTNDAANHWWLFMHINNVMTQCLEAIPKEMHEGLAETAIYLPLPGERCSGVSEDDWPEVITKFKFESNYVPKNKLKWVGRINELIFAVENGSDLDRDRALLRLYTLFKKRLLSGDQRDYLAKAIWSKTGDDGWP